MANFTINRTGSEIQDLLGKVASAEDTVEEDSTNLIESGAVFNALSDITITTDNIADSTLIESDDTFPDSDDKIPTCGAVKGLVDGFTQSTVVGCGVFTIKQSFTSTDTHARNTSGNIPLYTSANPITTGSVGTLSNNIITLPAGTYFVQPNFQVLSSSTGTWDLELWHNNTKVYDVRAVTGGSEKANLIGGVFLQSSNQQTLRVYADEQSNGTLVISNSSQITVSRLY